jgi:hypothetical protein
MPKKTDSSSSADGGTLDVAKTNKTANTGSRPIIVTNRPMVEDPMVVSGKKDASRTSQEPPSAPELVSNTPKLATSPRKSKILQPIPTDSQSDTNTKSTSVKKSEDTSGSENETASQENQDGSSLPAADTDSEKDTATTSEIGDDKPAETDQESEAASDTPEENPDTDSGLVDELAKQAASKKQQQEEDKADATQREKMAELIAAKTYYVPITQVAKRRAQHFVLIIILLALVLAGLNFAADGGIIDLGIQPLTDVITD